MLGPLWADLAKIPRGKQARVRLQFKFRWDVLRYTSTNCLAAWGLIQLKYYVVNGLGYGYG